MTKLTSDVAEQGLIGAMLFSETAALEAPSLVTAEMFADRFNRQLFRSITLMAARGEQVDAVTLAAELEDAYSDVDSAEAIQYVSSIMDSVGHIGNERYYADVIVRRWQAREAVSILENGASFLREKNYRDGGRRLADSLTANLLQLYANGSGAPLDRVALMDELIMRAEDPDWGQIDLPWQKLNDAVLGPLAPGELVGISAYSGGGKTTLVANIVRGLCSRGVPCIVFPTEMATRWVARMAAAQSVTSQRAAERGKWDDDPVGMVRYQRTLEKMKDWPLEVVPSPDISIEEVLNRTRALRQRWPDQTVCVFVDHFHRLDYGRGEANKLVGEATRQLKNFVSADTAMIGFPVFQPRKPEGVALGYDKPVRYTQIRGDSAVGNELDVHMSPFRPWVETWPDERTPWGTRRTRLDHRGLPTIVDTPEDYTVTPNRKEAEEHAFVSVDKRRIGGGVKTIVLDMHGPSGAISQGDPLKALQPVQEELAPA